MVIGKSDTQLSGFINQASADDLTTIATQLFKRVGTLDSREQDRFVQEVGRDPEAKRLFEKMQAYSR
jgi:hypothetical protein